MDRNDRNNSDNARQRQGQQNFRRNPQRPPAPDYRSRQRDGSGYERGGERPSRQDGGSRMNPRTGQNPRAGENKYDLPDRPQQQKDPRESIMNDMQREQDRFSRDPGRQQDRRTGSRGYARHDSDSRRAQPGNDPQPGSRNAGDNRSDGRDSWQREPGSYSRRNDGSREPRRFDPHGGDRQQTQDSRQNRQNSRGENRMQDSQRTRRPDFRESSKQGGRNDLRGRSVNSQRSTHDEDFYNAPRATDPRRRGDASTRYEGMGEGAVDLKSFDINYKGDSDRSQGFKAPSVATSLLGKPVLLGSFAVAAILVTVVIFAVISAGKKERIPAVPGTDKKYEYNIPDTVTIGGVEINTDSDYIELSEKNITDIGDLSYCYLVNSLFINGNSISDLTAIGDCISLKTIDASSNQLSEISALSHLNQLEDIDVSNNQIADLSPVAGLKSLERLSVGKNRITDLTPLADCSSLRQLIISDNSVSELLPIAALANLTTLEAANNQITDVSALGTLTNISTLNLGGNNISDIKPLKSLSSLTMLDLSGNPISDVSALHNLKGLLELNLTGTKVSKEDIAQLKKDLPGCSVRK